MLLAQETPIMLLDEPTTHLDIAHQIAVLDLLKELTRQHNRSIVMVLHDINLAVRYADNLIAMRDGKKKTLENPHNVVSAQMMHEVFTNSLKYFKTLSQIPIMHSSDQKHITGLFPIDLYIWFI